MKHTFSLILLRYRVTARVLLISCLWSLDNMHSPGSTVT